MTERIRIRARVTDGTAEVVLLMPHPMETGLRKDAAGALVPAHYITDVKASVGDRVVMQARMSIAVSADPLLSFRFKGAQPGDRLTVSWNDNAGERRVDEETITWL